MKKEMRCAVFTGQRVVEFQRFPIPGVDDDKLLAKIEACGICAWEQRVFTGGINTSYPLIGGYEVAGRIETTGKGVHGDWEVGQRAIAGVTLPYRSCYSCKTHEEQSYQNFNTAQVLSGQPYPGTGGFSEYMIVVPYSVFPYINVTPQETCICEPISCVIHSVEAVNPQLGGTCVITGAGITGFPYTQLCVRKDCFVVIVDVSEERLEVTTSMGTHHMINPYKEYAEKRIMKITHGKKARAVFDTTPTAGVVEEACCYVGNMGKLMIYSGIYPNKPVQMGTRWIHKGGIRILGTANSNDHDFMRAACMISKGIIGVKPSINGAYPVEEVSSVLTSSCQGNTFRDIITFSEELQGGVYAGYNKRTVLYR